MWRRTPRHWLNPYRTRTVLSVEPLGDRVVPTVDVHLDGSTLFITGDAAANVGSLVEKDYYKMTVTFGGSVQEFEGVRAVVADLGGGDDVVSLVTRGTAAASVKIDFGGGDDEFAAQYVGVKGEARDVELTVSGGPGDDRLAAAYDVKIRPTFEIASAARATFDGGDGDDVLTVVAGVSAGKVGSGRLEVALMGSGGDDSLTADIRQSGIVLARQDVRLDGGAGDDDLFLNTDADGVTTFAPADNRFELRGGAGDDVLVPIQCNAVGPSDVREFLRADGGAGDDSIFAWPMWKAPPDVPATGRLFTTTELLGGDGRDGLTAILCNGTPAGGTTDVRADGGAGDDVIRVETERPIPTGDGYGQTIDLVGREGDDALVAVLCDLYGPADRYFTRLDGGVGDDQLEVRTGGEKWAPNPYVAAEMKVVLFGGAGDDSQLCSLTFNGQTLTALDVSADGGAGRDLIRLTLEREEQSYGGFQGGVRTLRVAATGGAGDDDLGLTLYGVVVPGTRADVLADGGAGDDRIVLDTDNQNPDGGLPTLRVFTVLGGGGNDAISVPIRCDLQPTGSTAEITVDGGAGDDRIDVRVESMEDDLGTTTVRVLGGAGDDFLSLEAVGDPKRFGGLLIDGGAGFDIARVFPGVEVKRCEKLI